MQRKRTLARLALLLALHGTSALAQAGPTPPATSLEDALQQMDTNADVVFAGEVTQVEHTGTAVVVSLLVLDGVRGAVTGDTYVLREWPGLWTDDPTRYVVGERRLLLLHAPSAAGFASPVGGSDGAIPLRGETLTGHFDMRWVATHLAATASRAHPDALTSTPQADGISAVPNAVDADVVLGVLHAWGTRR